MSEYYKEQHPLLCEEISDEEHYSPRYHRRLRPMSYRGRTKNNLKGAASIISRWPDHWSSVLAYWWIGLGMISLLTFIIYNTLFAFSILPSASLKPLGVTIGHGHEKTPPKVILPDVYMHIFVRQNEEVDFNEYIPYIEIISNKYMQFKYHLLIVLNDTNLDWLSAEENNHIAMNSLWTKDPKKEPPPKSNIIIEYVTLSTYMDNSPLGKYWRTLPPQLIEFLARANSIWDKGGITFNPNILTPRSQHTLYTEKLQKILEKYTKNNKAVSDVKVVSKNKTVKKERKLNNIRDIINALENEDNSINAFSHETLTEAENIQSPIISRNERHVNTATETWVKNDSGKKTESPNHIQMHPHFYSFASNTKESKHQSTKNNSSTEPTKVLDVSHNTTKMSLLPLFLEFLFHNKLNDKLNPTEATIVNRTRKSVIEVPKPEDKVTYLPTHHLDKNDKNVADAYKPVIVSAAGIYNTSELFQTSMEPSSKETDEPFEKNRLTIDLKGHIIATDTPCHAFLGTVFSNAIHHSEEESVTDFIIAELTVFCKGLLSSCMGIDLILL